MDYSTWVLLLFQNRIPQAAGLSPPNKSLADSPLVRFHPPCTLCSSMSSHQMKGMSTTGMQEIGRPTSKELDDANLARMGKRPVLKVRIASAVLCLGDKWSR